MIVRDETRTDVATIRALVAAAFVDAPHSNGSEANIIDRLRADGALSVSLVAEEDGAVVGHVAFSPVSIGGEAGWYGLGPLAVAPSHRKRGIGAALVNAGLDRLHALGAKGCVVLGDPAYYGRFGFGHDPGVRLANVPPQYFQRLAIRGEPLVGLVEYHAAFT